MEVVLSRDTAEMVRARKELMSDAWPVIIEHLRQCSADDWHDWELSGLAVAFARRRYGLNLTRQEAQEAGRCAIA